MPEDLQMMAIKQEPVEWPDFEHENASINKSSIEVAVKPELIYSKGDTDEEGMTSEFLYFFFHFFFILNFPNMHTCNKIGANQLFSHLVFVQNAKQPNNKNQFIRH